MRRGSMNWRPSKRKILISLIPLLLPIGHLFFLSPEIFVLPNSNLVILQFTLSFLYLAFEWIAALPIIIFLPASLYDLGVPHLLTLTGAVVVGVVYAVFVYFCLSLPVSKKKK
ncbi:MAG: hypothetical protein ABIP54_04665 [Candidatus Andersenbacteria bacterium]